MEDKLLNICKSDRNSHQKSLSYRWLEKMILNLKMIFPQIIMHRDPVLTRGRGKKPSYLKRNFT